MPWIEIAVGIFLLFFGRPLFWAFVAIVGFLLGVHVSQVLLAQQAPWVGLLAAVAFGIVGGVLAMFAERVAFALGGLAAGGYLALSAAQSLQLGGSPVVWFAVGGALGALAAIWIMDWAIILLSCLVGAGAVVTHIGLGLGVSVVLYGALVATGALFQASRLERPAPAARG